MLISFEKFVIQTASVGLSRLDNSNIPRLQKTCFVRMAIVYKYKACGRMVRGLCFRSDCIACFSLQIAENQRKISSFLEVPKTDKSFEERLIFKTFILKFVNAFSPIIYIAFFRGRLVSSLYFRCKCNFVALN